MSTPNSSESSWTVRGGEGAYSGLSAAGAVILGLAAFGCIVYSLYIQGITGATVCALGLIYGLAGITCVLGAHAARLRYRLVEASQWKPPQWGRAENNQDLENPYIIEFEQGRSIHFWLLGMVPVVIFLSAALYLFFFLNQSKPEYFDIVHPQSMLLGVLGFVFSCVTLILARSFESASNEDLPEAGGLSSAMREVQVITLVTASVLVAKSWIGPAEAYLTRILLCWLFIVGVEMFARLLMGWLNRSRTPEQFSSPIDLLTRKVIFVLGNPVAGLFNSLESKYGISFRSSWAIRFVAKATLPAFVMVLLLSWALSSLSVVRLGEMGLKFSYGQVVGEPLTPGLYFKLPWPLGQVKTWPVKQVVMTPIGFVCDEEKEHSGSAFHAYLWTKTHGQEFELLLGNGNEAVSVNAVVAYKIREDKKGFLQYAFSFQNPKDVLEAYAYKTLMEVTRSKTVDEVLTVDREAFANQICHRLNELCDQNELGIEIIEVALLNLHPPVDAAEDYLDVISAGIDAQRAVIEKQGQKKSQILAAQKESAVMVSSGKIDALKLIAQAQERSSEFLEVGEAYRIAPDAFKRRYWLNTIEQTLANKKLVLVDKDLPLFWDTNKAQSGSAQGASLNMIRAE